MAKHEELEWLATDFPLYLIAEIVSLVGAHSSDSMTRAMVTMLLEMIG